MLHSPLHKIAAPAQADLQITIAIGKGKECQEESASGLRLVWGGRLARGF
jgi:hypothetical protein